jgi:hypothetical protein
MKESYFFLEQKRESRIKNKILQDQEITSFALEHGPSDKPLADDERRFLLAKKQGGHLSSQ